jgi:hypothetical protein
VLLADAQKAYDLHLKHNNDGTEKRAWSKLRSSKSLVDQLKHANYELRVMSKLEAARFARPAGAEPTEEEAHLSQAGAAEGGGRGSRAGRSAGGASDSAFIIVGRKWSMPSDEEQPAAAAAVANIMDGGLPSTDGEFLAKQLAAMFLHLKGHFSTFNDDKFPFVGGALSKLVFWLGAEKQRDLNPAAAPADHALQYRPQPQLQVAIHAEPCVPPSRKRVRHVSVHSLHCVALRCLLCAAGSFYACCVLGCVV